jgi:hypothetical protein
MRMNTVIILVALMLLGSHNLQAQVLTVNEDSERSDVKEKREKWEYIDINSDIEILISKDKLRSAINQQLPGLTEQVGLSDKIEALTNALTNQKQILSILESKVQSNQMQSDFFGLMSSFFDDVKKNSFLEQHVENLYNELFNTPDIFEKYKTSTALYIFENLNRDLNNLQIELDEYEGKKFKVSLAAFTKNKKGGAPVHIDNFDTYSRGVYRAIPRWVTTLSEDQKKQIDSLSVLAAENNKKTESVFKQLLGKLKAELPSISLNCVSDQWDSLKGFIDKSTVSTNIDIVLKTKINDFLTEIKRIENAVEVFKSDIANWTITSPFEVIDTLNGTIKGFDDFITKFTFFQKELDAILAIATEVSTLKNGFLECFNELKAEFEELTTTLGILFNQQANYIANKKIGDKVLKFSINELPEKGYIELKRVGQRDNGDELQIELIILIPSSQSGLPDQEIILEKHNLIMQLLGLRSEVIVGLIMADPFEHIDTASNIDRKFFFAPSAALLLKLGTKNKNYNNFIDFGFGLNFAAPDFDIDGTPEFGTGLIFTAFKDIMSTGINYNVNRDSFYWFFGINLPFNLPGIPINTPK